MNCFLQNVKYLEQSVWFCMLLEGFFFYSFIAAAF